MSQHQNQQSRGIQLMIIGSLLLPLMDASAKAMGETYPAALIVLARFVFQSLFLLPFVWKSLHLPRGLELRLHFWRALSICFGTLTFFYAIQVMPLADALAIFFVMPLLVTLLAPWVLGEKYGWRRLVAVVIGLMGALIIIQPGRELFGWRAFVPLATALGFAFYLLFTRQLARSGVGGGVSPLAMQFYSGVFGAMIILIVIVLTQPLQIEVFQWQWPELWQWRQLLLVGFFAAVSHSILTQSFKHADASILAPFQYIELISAALIGWVWFGDIPRSSTWLGAAILIASGLYIWHRERLHQNN